MTEPDDFEQQSDRWPWAASWPLALLTLISVFNYLDRSLLGLALPMVKREFGTSDSMLGLVSGLAFILLYSVIGLPIAWAADRSNRRNIIAAGLAFWSLMTMATGFVISILGLAAARFLMGAGEACALPPANSMIADLFHPRRRSLALAIFGTANSIAFMVFYPLAGWIAQAHGWRAMFIAMGVPGIPIALLLLLTVREPARRSAPPPRAALSLSGIGTDLAALFANRTFRWIFAGVTLMGANVWAASAWTPTFFARVHHMSVAQVGATVGPVRGIIGAVGILAGGVLIDRLPPSRTRWRILLPALACLLTGPAEAVFLLGDLRPLWLTGFVLASFLTLIHQAPIYAATVNTVAAHQRALAIAVILFGASFIGNVIGPSAIGFLNDALKPALGDQAIRTSMLTIAVTPVLAGACFWWASRVQVEPSGGSGEATSQSLNATG